MRRAGAKIEVLSVQNYHLRYVSHSDAQEMVELKQARWRSSSRIQLTALERQEKASAATLTRSEMEMNAYAQAGLARSRTAALTEEQKVNREWQGRPAEDFVECAVAKVAVWPEIGDTRAVRVGPVPA